MKPLKKNHFKGRHTLQFPGNLGLPIVYYYSPLRQVSECISIPKRIAKLLRKKVHVLRRLHMSLQRTLMGLLKNTDGFAEISMASQREKHTGSETGGDTWLQWKDSHRVHVERRPMFQVELHARAHMDAYRHT